MKPDDQNWPPSWPRVSPRRWWRDYESECLDWWRSYCRQPSTTIQTMTAILVARFGTVLAGDALRPLCELVPPGYIVPANDAAIGLMQRALDAAEDAGRHCESCGASDCDCDDHDSGCARRVDRDLRCDCGART